MSDDDHPRSDVPWRRSGSDRAELGHADPERAALGGFPPGQARVVRVRTDPTSWDCSVDRSGEEVEVELMTNEPPFEYRYFVHVERRHGRWFEGVSHN
jgi:hypothetical protein